MIIHPQTNFVRSLNTTASSNPKFKKQGVLIQCKGGMLSNWERQQVIELKTTILRPNQGRGRRLLKISYQDHPPKCDVTSGLRCLHRVLRARAPMMRALVMCAL